MKTVRLEKTNQHELVPVMLVLANITLILAVHLLHEWYVVSYTTDPVLLKAYKLNRSGKAHTYAINRLWWGLAFTFLLLLKVLSLKVNKFAASVFMILLTLVALMAVWC